MDGQLPSNETRNGLILDLFHYTGEITSFKHYDICNFITTILMERKKGSSIKAGEVELNFWESKPKLNSITSQQYTEVSLWGLLEKALMSSFMLYGILAIWQR